MKNYYKFGLSLFFTALVIVFLTNCGGSEAPSEEAAKGQLSLIMVTDQAGLGDHGFNDSGWAGVNRAVKDFGIKANFIQSSEQADYVPNLSIAAKKADVVVAMGFLMKDAVIEVAPKYPDTKFIFIDGKIEGSNIASFDFKGEEAAFLSGFISAGVSRSGKLGVVKGMDIPPVLALEYGYRAGVMVAKTNLNRNLGVKDMTVGSFNDPVKGKSLARNLMSDGSDVIFQIAGNSGIGVIELFKNTKRPGFLISSDIDIEDKIPGKVLTCVMKRFDNAVYNATKEIVDGNFTPGYFNIGLKEGAVELTPMKHTKSLIDPEVLKKADVLKAAIIKGQITVPSTEDSFERVDFSTFAQEFIK